MSGPAKTPAQGDVVVHVQGVTVNLSPLGFHLWAGQFLAAARAVEKGPPFSPVPYYLYAHALELALKAFLLANGEPKKRLKGKKGFGHDLKRCLKRALRLGLEHVVTVDADERQALDLTNALYPKKHLEYFDVVQAVTGYGGWPDLAVLDRFTVKLVNGVEPVCREAADM